jgi:hypothetical protein
VIAFLLWPPVGAREALRKNPVRDLAARVFSLRGILFALCYEPMLAQFSNKTEWQKSLPPQ